MTKKNLCHTNAFILIQSVFPLFLFPLGWIAEFRPPNCNNDGGKFLGLQIGSKYLFYHKLLNIKNKRTHKLSGCSGWVVWNTDIPYSSMGCCNLGPEFELRWLMTSAWFIIKVLPYLKFIVNNKLLLLLLLLVVQRQILCQMFDREPFS